MKHLFLPIVLIVNLCLIARTQSIYCGCGTSKKQKQAENRQPAEEPQDPEFSIDLLIEYLKDTTSDHIQIHRTLTELCKENLLKSTKPLEHIETLIELMAGESLTNLEREKIARLIRCFAQVGYLSSLKGKLISERDKNAWLARLEGQFTPLDDTTELFYQLIVAHAALALIPIKVDFKENSELADELIRMSVCAGGQSCADSFRIKTRGCRISKEFAVHSDELYLTELNDWYHQVLYCDYLCFKACDGGAALYVLKDLMKRSTHWQVRHAARKAIERISKQCCDDRNVEHSGAASLTYSRPTYIAREAEHFLDKLEKQDPNNRTWTSSSVRRKAPIKGAPRRHTSYQHQTIS